MLKIHCIYLSPLIILLLWMSSFSVAYGKQVDSNDVSNTRQYAEDSYFNQTPQQQITQNQGQQNLQTGDRKKPVGPDGPKEPLGAKNDRQKPNEKAAPGIGSVDNRNQGNTGIHILSVLTLLFFIAVLIRERISIPRKDLVGYSLLFILSMVIRWLWPEQTVFHENHHGYDYLRSIDSGFGQTYGFTSSYIVLMNLLAKGFQPIDDGVFFWNAVMASLQAPVIAALFSKVSNHKPVGWMAGIMWTLTPHAIRLAPTETYFNFITLLLLLAPLVLQTAMARIREWKRPVNAWLWTLVALGIVIIEAKSRVLTLIHPLAVLLVAIGMGAGKTAREKMALIFGSIAVAAALIGQLFNILKVAEHAPQGRSLVDLNHFIEYGHDFVFFNPEVVSPLVFPLALLGAVFLIGKGIQERTLRPLFTISGILYLAIVAGSVHGTFPSRVRFELPVHAFLTGLAAMGVWTLAQTGNHPNKRARALFRKIGVTVGTLGLCLIALSTHSWVLKPMHEQIEYPFLRNEVLPALRAHEAQTILIPDAPAPTGTIPEHWWNHHVPDRKWGTSAPDDTAELMYVGLECFWTAPGWQKGFPYDEPFPENIATTEGRIAAHPACAKVAGNHVWKPLKLKKAGRAIPNPCVDLKPGVSEVYFGLFERVGGP